MVRTRIPFGTPPRLRKKFDWVAIPDVPFMRDDGHPFPLADALSTEACRKMRGGDLPLFDADKTGTKITYVVHVSPCPFEHPPLE